MTQQEREMNRNPAEGALGEYLAASSAQSDHPYLQKKKAGLYGDLRQSGDDLLVPLCDLTTGALVSYQRIRPDGTKSLAAPLAERHAAFSIAGDIKEGPVILCVDAATGLTLYEALSFTTICALTPRNLIEIAGVVREKYPDRKIYVAADDDSPMEGKPSRNPGLEAAKKAMASGLGGILRPPFLAEDDGKAATWNDYALLHGPEATERALRRQIGDLPTSPEERKRGERGETIEKIRQRTRMVNAADLMKRELPEIRWAIDGILPAGLGVLIGRPKTGKSSMTLGIVLAVATGSAAFERIPTEAGDVLYLALEDTERRLQQRIRAMGYAGENLSRADFVFELPRQHEGGLVLIGDWLKNHPQARLVVIDTLQKFRKPRTPNANAYEDDYETLSSVKTLADRYEVAVLFVHHEKKSRDAEDFINNASGSAAVTGAADCLLFLNRARLQGLGKLNITGRDVEEREYALSLSGMNWRLEGDAEEFAVARDKRQILDYLRENGETSPKELANALEIRQNTMRQKLLRMNREGLVYSNAGKYGAPIRTGELAG